MSIDRKKGELLRAVFEMLWDQSDGLTIEDILDKLPAYVNLADYEQIYPPSYHSTDVSVIVSGVVIDAFLTGWLRENEEKHFLTERGRQMFVQYPDPVIFYRKFAEDQYGVLQHQVFFGGDFYNDDRLLIFELDQREEEDHVFWTVMTKQNLPEFPVLQEDHFDTKEAATGYIQNVEPTTPLISLGGKSPITPLPYSEYCERLKHWDLLSTIERYVRYGSKKS